jgi:hypothetical protein
MKTNSLWELHYEIQGPIPIKWKQSSSFNFAFFARLLTSLRNCQEIVKNYSIQELFLSISYFEI